MALLPDINLTSLLIPLKDIQEATDNFDEKNLISSGDGLGPAYKGQLLRSGEWIKIVARKLDRRYGLGELEFWNEVKMLSELNHRNLVSMIGYCVGDQGEKITITTYESRGSLACKLNSPSLTWTRRLNICLGVARALSYLHFEEGREYSVMHCNINSNTILLDKNWEPKLSDFEICIKQVISRMDLVFPSEALGMEDYMDPEIEKTGGVTYKSDVYSFGVVLLEILSGRLVVIADEASTSLVQLVRHHRKNSTAPDFVHPDLWSQMSSRSVKKFYEIACDCVEEERAHRPEMAKVVRYLEEALEFQLQRENLGREKLFRHVNQRRSNKQE